MRLNTKKGDCAIQHFDLIHRSAKNRTENKVRYTILLRTGNLMSPNFIPSSWAS